MTMFTKTDCLACSGDDPDCTQCDGEGTVVKHEGGPCDVCGRPARWGCGHDAQMEAEAREHMASPEHTSGSCWHFDHDDCDPAECSRAGIRVPGYAAFVKHSEAPEFFAKLNAGEFTT